MKWALHDEALRSGGAAAVQGRGPVARSRCAGTLNRRLGLGSELNADADGLNARQWPGGQAPAPVPWGSGRPSRPTTRFEQVARGRRPGRRPHVAARQHQGEERQRGFAPREGSLAAGGICPAAWCGPLPWISIDQEPASGTERVNRSGAIQSPPGQPSSSPGKRHGCSHTIRCHPIGRCSALARRGAGPTGIRAGAHTAGDGFPHPPLAHSDSGGG
jgi:hypothetical protein